MPEYTPGYTFFGRVPDAVRRWRRLPMPLTTRRTAPVGPA